MVSKRLSYLLKTPGAPSSIPFFGEFFSGNFDSGPGRWVLYAFLLWLRPRCGCSLGLVLRVILVWRVWGRGSLVVMVAMAVYCGG